jgi:hypothetical protein
MDYYTIEFLIFLCTYLAITKFTDTLVKTIGLLAQMIAAIFAVYHNAPPALCILSAVLAFIFGAMEGGVSLLWKRHLS